VKKLVTVLGALLAPEAALAQMDHSQMDHGTGSHGAMDHGAMDHSAMNHAVMDHGSGDMAWMSMNGMGSGTSRLPMNEPMRGVHLMPGPRGGTKFYAQTMAMAMWIHDLSNVLGDGAKLTGQAMMSLEPAMCHDGYPLLFATGEEAYGSPLVDRQHPLDMFAIPAPRRRG
jgi:hypothetical protein